MHRVATLGVALVLLTGAGACTSDDDRTPPAATGSREPAAPPTSCTPSPILGDRLEGGSNDGTSVAALIERTTSGPVRTGEELKIIVRMTGAGPLQVSPIGPDGTPTGTDWGPEKHLSSSFHRPGDEWGFGVTFPTPGCWTIALSRSQSGSGYLQLEVA